MKMMKATQCSLYTLAMYSVHLVRLFRQLVPSSGVSESRLIKDLPDEDRPREKLERYGGRVLSDAEILAIFFGTGREGLSVIDLARELLDEFGSLRRLARADVSELQKVKGIGPAKIGSIGCGVRIWAAAGFGEFSRTANRWSGGRVRVVGTGDAAFGPGIGSGRVGWRQKETYPRGRGVSWHRE